MDKYLNEVLNCFILAKKDYNIYIDELFYGIDMDGDNTIEYREFMMMYSNIGMQFLIIY